MSKVSIIGAGTWGIALANMLCLSHHDVTVYSAIEDEIDFIEKYRKHPKLKDTKILDEIELTKDLSMAVVGFEVIVMAVPSIYVRDTIRQVAQFLNKDQIIVDVAKGIEPERLLTMSEIIYEEIQQFIEFDYGHIVALSGPTHAEEVSIGLPSTIVSASADYMIAKRVQEIFTSSFMRVYTNNDIKGVELCGALKNIIALSAGIAHGLGYGDNATAALVTRGIHEISRLGVAMGCPIHTFYGLAGIGDLVVTCTSLHSRNNQCGIYIGKGYSVKEAIDKVGMVVEGINALDAAYALSIKYNVELPIIKAVYDTIKFNTKPEYAVRKLYERESKSEMPFSILELMYENSSEKETKRVIAFNTFDVMDYSCLQFLKKAKSLGDYLIVVIKHQEQCDIDDKTRKSFIESLRFVDLVIEEESYKHRKDICKEYHIDICVKDKDDHDSYEDLKDIEIISL